MLNSRRIFGGRPIEDRQLGDCNMSRTTWPHPEYNNLIVRRKAPYFSLREHAKRIEIERDDTYRGCGKQLEFLKNFLCIYPALNRISNIIFGVQEQKWRKHNRKISYGSEGFVRKGQFCRKTFRTRF